MIPNKITILVNHSIYPVIGTNYSRQNHERTIKLIEYLIEYEPDHSLIEIMCNRINFYEENAMEFSNFNISLKAKAKPNTLI